jgi:hypothetical protein
MIWRSLFARPRRPICLMGKRDWIRAMQSIVSGSVGPTDVAAVMSDWD